MVNSRCFDAISVDWSDLGAHPDSRLRNQGGFHPPFDSLFFLDFFLLFDNFTFFHFSKLNLFFHEEFASVFKLTFRLSISKAFFHTKEHGSHFGQPIGIDSSDAMHIFFRSHNELMVYHKVRCVTEHIEST